MAFSSPVPMGIGTPQAESLSSYVQRLAAFHGTLPSQLVHRFLAYIAAKDHGHLGRWRRRTGSLCLGRNINGFAHADAWLNALYPVFEQPDLRRLTTRPWDAGLGSRHLLSPFSYWCVDCLREDETPYCRLLWCLDIVRVCFRHGRWLSGRCPTCGRRLPPIHSRSQVTRCPWCAESLICGSSEANLPAAAGHEMWVASELGRLIAATSAVETVFQPLCGPHLRECCRQGGIHHPTALARCLGTSKVTTWYWWNEHAAPSLPMTLRICEVLGVHLADVFLGPHLLPPAETEYSVQLELHLSARAKARRIQWSAVRMRLQRELRRPIAKARSLLAVGRDLGIDSRTLREREPVLCRRIGRRFVRSVHLAAQAKHAVLKRRIAEACVKLQRQRHPITHARIAAVIGQPGLFCRPDARRALAEVLKLDYADWPQAVTVPGRLRSR